MSIGANCRDGHAFHDPQCPDCWEQMARRFFDDECPFDANRREIESLAKALANAHASGFRAGLEAAAQDCEQSAVAYAGEASPFLPTERATASGALIGEAVRIRALTPPKPDGVG